MGSAISGEIIDTAGVSYPGSFMRIAIVGGGIAGLAAAYELEKARTNNPAIRYTLFESRSCLGGSLASEIVDGTVLERGPDSFLTEKPAAAELARELGPAPISSPPMMPTGKPGLRSESALSRYPMGSCFWCLPS